MRTETPESSRCVGPPRRIARTALAAGTCLAALCTSLTPAHAQEFVIHGEVAPAFFVDDPQSDHFRTGIYAAVRPGVSLHPIVAVQWSYALLFAANNPDGYTEKGSAHFLSTGLRFRPLAMVGRPERQLSGLWLDGNVGYVRTGDLDRFGFDAGLGYNFQVAPGFALGPSARYGQIVQKNDVEGMDPNDAQWISVGLNVTFGTPRRVEDAPVEKVCPDAPECEPVTALQRPVPAVVAAAPCPDGDGDGVCDSRDRCPDKAGPAATYGCPIDPCGGAPLYVMVQFEFDSAEMPKRQESDPQTMDPVLDAVAEAIAQDRSCRVCIVGHASEEGAVDYNQKLSLRRAEAVSDYLTARGLADRKMPVSGMGVSCPLVPEQDLESNRRVEFIRLAEGASCPTTCTR